MRLVEVVLQGVIGLPPELRISLHERLNGLLVHPRASGEPFVRALMHLMFGEETESLAAAGAPISRGALTFRDESKRLYRLVRDFATGTVVLSEVDEGTQQSKPYIRGATDIAQYLGAQMHLPGAGLFRDACLVQRSQLPSRRPMMPALALSSGGGGMMLGEDDDAPRSDDLEGLTKEQLEQRRAELGQQLAFAEEVRHKEYELEGLQKQRFDLEDSIRGTKKDHSVAEALKKELEKYEELEDLDESFRISLDRYDASLDRFTDDMKRWESESQEVLSHPVPKQAPIWRDRFFLGGLGAGVVGILAALALHDLAGMRYLALLDIPGFGVAMWLALVHIGVGEENAKLTARQDRLRERKDKLQRAFDDDTAFVRKILQRLNNNDTEYIRERLIQRDELRGRLAEAEGQLSGHETSPHVAQVRAQIAEIDRQSAEFETELQKVSGTVNITQIKEQIEAVERRLKPRGAHEAPVLIATGPPDACTQLLQNATGLFHADLATVARMVSQRLPQYIAAVSQNRYIDMQSGPDGRSSLTAAGAPPAALAAMAPADQDLAVIALKLCLAENYTRQDPMPLVLDEAFADLPPAALPVALRVVKYLSGQTQVLLLTRVAAMAQSCDASSELQ